MNYRSLYIILSSIVAIFIFLWMVGCCLYVYASYDVEESVSMTPIKKRTVDVPSVQLCYTFDPGMKEAALADIWNSFPAPDAVLDAENSMFNHEKPLKDFEVKKLIRGDFVCYDIRIKSFFRDIHSNPGKPIAASIVMKPDVNKNKDQVLYMFVHTYKTPISTMTGFASVSRGTSAGVTITLSYRTDSFMLLPEPYVTNCKSYRETNTTVPTPYDCFNKCLLSRQNATDVPSNAVVYDETLLTRKRDFSNDSIHAISSKCIFDCQPECFSEVISPRIVSAAPSDMDRIDILTPYEPGTTMVLRPRMLFYELLWNLMKVLLLAVMISPVPILALEKVITSVIHFESESKGKRNGVAPSEVRTLGNGVGNGVNIVNSFTNNNASSSN